MTTARQRPNIDFSIRRLQTMVTVAKSAKDFSEALELAKEIHIHLKGQSGDGVADQRRQVKQFLERISDGAPNLKGEINQLIGVNAAASGDDGPSLLEHFRKIYHGRASDTQWAEKLLKIADQVRQANPDVWADETNRRQYEGYIEEARRAQRGGSGTASANTTAQSNEPDSDRRLREQIEIIMSDSVSAVRRGSYIEGVKSYTEAIALYQQRQTPDDKLFQRLLQGRDKAQKYLDLAERRNKIDDMLASGEWNAALQECRSALRDDFPGELTLIESQKSLENAIEAEAALANRINPIVTKAPNKADGEALLELRNDLLELGERFGLGVQPTQRQLTLQNKLMAAGEAYSIYAEQLYKNAKSTVFDDKRRQKLLDEALVLSQLATTLQAWE